MSTFSMTEYLDKLPESIKPAASALIDSIVDGLLDNAEAATEALVLQGASEAYEKMLKTMTTEGLVTSLAKANMELGKLGTETFSAAHDKFMGLLITIAFSILRETARG